MTLLRKNRKCIRCSQLHVDVQLFGWIRVSWTKQTRGSLRSACFFLRILLLRMSRHAHHSVMTCCSRCAIHVGNATRCYTTVAFISIHYCTVFGVWIGRYEDVKSCGLWEEKSPRRVYGQCSFYLFMKRGVSANEIRSIPFPPPVLATSWAQKRNHRGVTHYKMLQRMSQAITQCDWPRAISKKVQTNCHCHYYCTSTTTTTTTTTVLLLLQCYCYYYYYYYYY